MKFFELKMRVIAPLVVVCFLAGVGGQVARAQSPPAWAQGDVFAGIGNGVYEVYHNFGTATSPNYVLVDTRNQGLGTGDYTTGCTFDLASNLYTTSFFNNDVVKFDANSPHSVLQTINTTGITPVNSLSNESVVFAGSGDFFVGHADPDHQVHRYNAAGTFQQAYMVTVEDRGSDWIDLSSDQHTLFYTSEGRLVKRFDVSANAQLPNFGDLSLISGTLFALRLLPPGDGTGGLLVVNTLDVKRLDSSGNVVQTYTATGENSFFALNLDPDGTSFWVGGYVTGKLYKFDIASGGIPLATIQTGATGFSPANLAGVCVKGQSTAVNTFTTPQQDITGQTVTFTDPGVIDQSIQFPNGTNRNGAAFMSVSFTKVAQDVFDSTRLPQTGETTPNSWSGGAPVPAGTTCTPIKSTGTGSTNDTCVVAENLCFDASHNPITPCNIIAGGTTLIQLTSHYDTSSLQPHPALIIASDGANDWANITNGFADCCTISGGTKGINSDETIVNLSSPYNALIQQPINSDGSSVFSAKKGVVPVKFTLTQNNAATCVLPPATITLIRTAGGTNGPIDESTYLSSADTGSNFRITSCQYVYNLAASSLGSGTYGVAIVIDGTVVGSGKFGLK